MIRHLCYYFVWKSGFVHIYFTCSAAVVCCVWYITRLFRCHWPYSKSFWMQKDSRGVSRSERQKLMRCWLKLRLLTDKYIRWNRYTLWGPLFMMLYTLKSWRFLLPNVFCNICYGDWLPLVHLSVCEHEIDNIGLF